LNSYQSNKARERNKGIQMGKEEVKLSLFADDIIQYLKDPKDSILKTCKVERYKISIQISVASLHTNNEQFKKEIWKTISFATASKKNLNT
jgi:hypothetical protein